MLEELEELKWEIEAQINRIIEDTVKPKGVSIYQMRHTDGKWLLTDLLVAKAQVMYAIALLTPKENS